MLREKTVSFNIVCIDLESILDVVFAAVDKTPNVMVCSPEPSVINDHILVIDFDHALSTDF